MTVQRRYGLLRDPVDQRDHLFLAGRTLAALPPEGGFPDSQFQVVDQGQMNSCTANAIGGSVFAKLSHLGLRKFFPSRLAIYLDERKMEGSVKTDGGAYIRDGMKVLVKIGVAPEHLWQYDPSRFAKTPPAKYYLEAKKTKAASYKRLSSLYDVKAALADGHVVVGGIAIHESFESPEVARTGIVPMPRPGEREIGLHAVLFTRYSDVTGRTRNLNSWGPVWGQKGFFELPYEYVMNKNLATDFWIYDGLTQKP